MGVEVAKKGRMRMMLMMRRDKASDDMATLRDL